MTHSVTDWLQITKKNVLIAVLLVSSLVLQFCTSNSATADEKQWCLKKTDSLWMILTQTRENFKYNMDEIASRKQIMQKQLQALTVATSQAPVSELTKSDILQYNSVYTVYKPLAARYKNAVLNAEDLFFRIKAFEKSTKNDQYKGKLNEFKATWAELDKQLKLGYEESAYIADQLTKVEPMYVRLAPKIDAAIEALGIDLN